MHFDKIIMNPPYDKGGRIIEKLRGKAEETVVLAPLSNYKFFKNHEYVKSFELVDNTMFDAIITPNLGIASLSKDSIGTKWENLQYITFDQRYIDFYKRNSKFPKKYIVKEHRSVATDYFDYSKDFIESSRLPNGQGIRANGYTIGNNIGYKINVLKQIPEVLNSNICAIHFPSEKAKDNFTTWAYSSKNKTNLANELIYGVKKNTASDACSIAIPQIDWETISNSPKWQEKKYDEIVWEIVMAGEV